MSDRRFGTLVEGSSVSNRRQHREEHVVGTAVVERERGSGTHARAAFVSSNLSVALLVVILMFGLAVRVAHLGRPDLHIDEVVHVFAAGELLKGTGPVLSVWPTVSACVAVHGPRRPRRQVRGVERVYGAAAERHLRMPEHRSGIRDGA